MKQKEVLAALDDCGLSFRIEGSKIVVTSAFKPYKLLPVRVDDFYKKHLVTRGPTPKKEYIRKYPLERGEYADFLQERARKSLDALEERQLDEREAKRESKRNVEEVALEKWATYDDDSEFGMEQRDRKEAYENRIEQLRKLLP